MDLGVLQDPVHAICTDDGAIALFEGHDRVIRLDAAGLSGSQGLGDDVGRGNHLRRAGGGGQVAGFLQGGVVVGELTDPAGAHDVGARVADVEGEPVGALGGPQDHEAGQGGAGRAHRVIDGRQAGDGGGRRVDGDGEVDQVDGAVSEALGAQELPQSDDCLRRGLGTAEVATHSIGDREDGRNRQPGVFIFGADGTDVSRRAPR